MKAIRMPAYDQDDDAAAAGAYVDEDDYTIDCDGLDGTEMLAAGLCLRRFDVD